MPWFRKKSPLTEVSLDQKSAQLAAVADVYSAITKAALMSTEALKSNFPELTTGIAKGDWLQSFAVTMEFYSFYLHMLDRRAYSELGESRRDALIDMAVEWGFSPMLRAMFPDSQEEWRSRVLTESLTNFDNAQREYGPCKEIIATDFADVLLDHPVALLSRLCRNISTALKKDADPPQSLELLWMLLAILVNEQLKALELDRRVAQVGRLLPMVGSSSVVPQVPSVSASGQTSPKRRKPRSRPMR